MKKRLVDDATREGVVADYKSGKRVLDIEETYGIPRATLYWILDQAGVLPERAKRGERLRGTTEDLTAMFQLIQAQEGYIELLEALLLECMATPGHGLPDELIQRITLNLAQEEGA